MAGRTWERISFGAAANAPRPEIDFCLPNLIAGGVGTVAADAGVGKTSLLLQLGAAVAAGIPLAGDALPAPKVSGKVVFLAAEDPAVILARRAHFLMKSFAAQGYSKETLDRLESHFQLSSLVGAAPKLLPIVREAGSMLDRLEMMATGARLLIFDPIRSFHDCNEQDYGMMSLLVKMLKDIARRTQCTILFSHHVNRRSAGGQSEAAERQEDPLEGLTAFVNPTRWVLNMRTMTPAEAKSYAIEPESTLHYVRVTVPKSNYGAPLEAFWLHRSRQFEGVFEHARFAVPGSV